MSMPMHVPNKLSEMRNTPSGVFIFQTSRNRWRVYWTNMYHWLISAMSIVDDDKPIKFKTNSDNLSNPIKPSQCPQTIHQAGWWGPINDDTSTHISHCCSLGHVSVVMLKNAPSNLHAQYVFPRYIKIFNCYVKNHLVHSDSSLHTNCVWYNILIIWLFLNNCGAATRIGIPHMVFKSNRMRLRVLLLFRFVVDLFSKGQEYQLLAS